MKNSIRLSDQQWALIAPHLPPPAHTGRPRADDRSTVEAILYVLRTGCRWQDLPDEYGIASTTAWRRLHRWEEDGTWERLWRALLGSLEIQEKLRWAEAFLDGSFVPAKRGGEAVGLTRKGKGTKWMIVSDGEGLPIGFLVESARKSEIQLARPTLSSVRVAGRRGRPRSRPSRLICDRGYDSRAFRSYLRKRGIKSCIPTRKRPKGWKPRRGRPPKAEKAFYRKRWKVERTFAWLGSYRRIVMRWEHLVGVYRGFVLIGMAMICLNRLLQ